MKIRWHRELGTGRPLRDWKQLGGLVVSLLVLLHSASGQALSSQNRAALMNTELKAGLKLVEAKLQMLRAAKVDLHDIDAAARRATAEQVKLEAAVKTNDARVLQQMSAAAKALRQTFDLINPVLKARPAGRLAVEERNRFNIEISKGAVAFVEAKLASRKQQKVPTDNAEAKLKEIRQQFAAAIEDTSHGQQERAANLFLKAFEEIDVLFTELNSSLRK